MDILPIFSIESITDSRRLPPMTFPIVGDVSCEAKNVAKAERQHSKHVVCSFLKKYVPPVFLNPNSLSNSYSNHTYDSSRSNLLFTAGDAALAPVQITDAIAINGGSTGNKMNGHSFLVQLRWSDRRKVHKEEQQKVFPGLRTKRITHKSINRFSSIQSREKMVTHKSSNTFS